jgi:hypothetical protein
MISFGQSFGNCGDQNRVDSSGSGRPWEYSCEARIDPERSDIWDYSRGTPGKQTYSIALEKAAITTLENVHLGIVYLGIRSTVDGSIART